MDSSCVQGAVAQKGGGFSFFEQRAIARRRAVSACAGRRTMQVAVHVRVCRPASLASAHAIPSLLAFARFRPPAAQIEVFGNNLRPLHRLWQLFPLAAMDALGTNFLTRHFAWKAFGKGHNSAPARSRKEHSTEIMVKNPETICKFGNYFRWVLQRRHAEGHTIAEGRSP